MAVGTACCQLQEDITRALGGVLFPEFQASRVYEALCQELGGPWDDGRALTKVRPGMVSRVLRHVPFGSAMSLHRPPLEQQQQNQGLQEQSPGTSPTPSPLPSP
ncbi:unnamed protein product, partial [Phaeothamnion confervicola]